MAEQLNILGCPCLSVPEEPLLARRLARAVEGGGGGFSAAINAEKIVRQRRDERMRNVIRHATLAVPDGAGAVIGMRLLHGARSLKVDFPRCVLRAADERRWRVFVYGAVEEVNALAVSRIKVLYPNINVVGRLHGYTPESELGGALAISNAMVVLLALGSPKQEFLAADFAERFPAMFFVGCGGALDVLAGRVQRAPRLFVDHNLEWAYRLVKQPSRLRRQMALPKFAIHLLYAAAVTRLSAAFRRAR